MWTWRCSGVARAAAAAVSEVAGRNSSHDTFSRIFRLLDPLGFEACFARYLAALSERVQGVVALDGKSARRSFDRQQGRTPLHLISAWACETRLVLGQLRVDGKSNEIPAVPELLALLAVEGCIVTADAMHAQKATAQAILDRGGDYVLALKANRPALFWPCACSSTIRRRRRTRWPAPPTATTAGSRPAAPRSSTTSPGSPKPTAFPA